MAMARAIPPGGVALAELSGRELKGRLGCSRRGLPGGKEVGEEGRAPILKTTNNDFVIQTSVIQTHSKEAFTNTNLSHRDTSDTLNETHTNSFVSQLNNPNVSQLYDMDYINIQKLLQRIKMPYRSFKRKDAKIELRVDEDTKLAWDLIVGHDGRLLEMI